MDTGRQPQPILIVEDSPEDYEFTVRELAKAALVNPLYRCADGDEALDFLFQRAPFTPETAPRPGVVVLDMGLPGVDGDEVVRQIKSDARLRDIPVVICTASHDIRDIQRYLELGGDGHVRKPLVVGEFLAALAELPGHTIEVTLRPKPRQP